MQHEKIPLLNLVRQQERIQERLHEAVFGAVTDGKYISDQTVTPFEEKLSRYCRQPHTVGVGSGTAALHIALIAADIGAGDEVVTVPNSFFATTEVILHVGARPVFVDIDAHTHLMTPEKLRDVITDRTRGILPVHLYGNVVDIDGIHRLLKNLGREDICVIEDSTHAIGAWRGGRPVPIGRVGAFSFNPGKNIGALGDAGAIVTSDPDIARTARLLRDHGRLEKNQHVMAGFNSRLSRINDRVLAVKIEFLDRWNERRRDIARRYDAELSDQVTPVHTEPDVLSAYHQYVVCSPDRETLGRQLEKNGIATAVHYPGLIPEQPLLKQLGYTLEGVPTAREVNRRILSLPCYPELTDAEVARIIRAVRLENS